MVDVDKAISTAVKTGKVVLGAASAIKNAQSGKAKMIMVAANCPSEIRGDIERYGGLSDIPVIVYSGTSLDLGMACGKPFMVSALSIKEAGDSDILKLIEQPALEEELEEKLYEPEEFVEEAEEEETAEADEAAEIGDEDTQEYAAEDEGDYEGEEVND